ncbi:MAG: hypothetical protein GY832_30130 [Chloroflexi bacterium]|nr:hypothetical protein [Chloroflexota bacterium]
MATNNATHHPAPTTANQSPIPRHVPPKGTAASSHNTQTPLTTLHPQRQIPAPHTIILHEVHHQVFSRAESDAIRGITPLFQRWRAMGRGQGSPPTNYQSPRQGQPGSSGHPALVVTDNATHRPLPTPHPIAPGPRAQGQRTTWVDQGKDGEGAELTTSVAEGMGQVRLIAPVAICGLITRFCTVRKQ